MSSRSASDAAPRHYTAIHLLNAALLAGLWLFTAATYGDLPERIPMHIGLSGTVTRWASQGSGMWFLLPIFGTFHALLMYALSVLASGSPAGLNVPGKERLLSLPPEGQRHALEPIRPFMFGMAAWLLALVAIIQLVMWDAAHAAAAPEAAGPTAVGGGGIPWLVLAVVAFATLPLPASWWLSRAIRRRTDHWISAHQARPGHGAGEGPT